MSGRRRFGGKRGPATHHGGAGPVPGYVDLTEIGRGASGRVYRARQERLGREVALKILDAGLDDRDTRRRFDRELEITVRLGSHPHIVQVLDAGQTVDGRPYLAMELFERGSAGDWLARNGVFATGDAVRAGTAIADALTAAHGAGVLHRDVKPENILLSAYGPALTDFGIARPADQLDRTSSFSQFTPWHAAPEVLLDRAPTEVADVYSLASTLFHLLDGRPPFAGPPGETLLAFQRRVLTEEHRTLPAGVDPELAAILTDGLHRDPDQRIRTAAELRDRLRGLGAGTGTAAFAPPSSSSPRPGRDADASTAAERAGSPTGFSPVLPPPSSTDPAAPGPDLGATAPVPRPAPPSISDHAPPAPPADAVVDPAPAAATPPTTAPPPRPPVPSSGPVGEQPDEPVPADDRDGLSHTRAAATSADPVPETRTETPVRRRWPIVVGALVVVAALGLAAWALTRDDDGDPPVAASTTTTTPTVPVTSNLPGTPEELAVTEEQGRAKLTWKDTSDGNGRPLVIVASPEGNEVDELEPGEQAATIDLRPGLGYCFKVMVFVTYQDPPTGPVALESGVECIRGAEPSDTGIEETASTSEPAGAEPEEGATTTGG